MRRFIGQPSDGDIVRLSDEEDPQVWRRFTTPPRTPSLPAGAGQAPVLLALAAEAAKAVGGLLALALVRPWDG